MSRIRLGLHRMSGRAVADRFWSKVDRSAGPDACWPWTAARSPAGYGRFRVVVDGRATHRQASRFAWCLANGQDVPPGQFVCHRCDNPPCCNPAHLWLGTHQDNQDDCVAKGRRPHGEGHGRAKLTAARVLEMRRLSRAGMTQANIAELFQVPRGTASHAIAGRTWKLLGGQP